MSDLIDRTLIGNLVDSNRNVHYDDILKLPSAQTERKTGRWIHEIVNNYTEKTYCSECGESVPFVLVSDDYYGVHVHGEDRETDFCPNCGARMEGVSDEQQ